MALNVGSLLGQVGQIFGGVQNPIFQGLSNVATTAGSILTAATQAPTPGVPAIPRPMPTMPGVVLRAGAMVGRGFFQRFPNLATAIQQLRNRGMNVKRSQLWSLLKRFGPEVLVTGGLLTAAAVSELMMAGPGRRRMNPANVTALRRSIRRLESFNKLCDSTTRLRRPRGRPGRKCPTATQFVRQG